MIFDGVFVKALVRAFRAAGIKTLADVQHVTFELRTEIWNKFIKGADPRQEKMRKRIAATFKRQFAEVLENVKNNPPSEKAYRFKADGDLTDEQLRFINLWLFNKDQWRKEFQDAALPEITGALQFGGADLFATLGIIEEFVTDAATKKFLREHVFTFAKEIGQTSTDKLTATFIDALRAGESRDEIMARVSSVMTNATEYRSKMIAQTEIIGAINKGSLEGCKQSGVVWGNQWIGALDERIRESHERLTISGAAVALGEKFDIGCEYPGDQSGPAGEVISCRCAMKPLTEKPK
ncbi:MAG: phage minor head protein [Dehalococcoidales bacterium]|nr:phage minor head protein [Dehalococcoidales bacterium]